MASVVFGTVSGAAFASAVGGLIGWAADFGAVEVVGVFSGAAFAASVRSACGAAFAADIGFIFSAALASVVFGTVSGAAFASAVGGGFAFYAAGLDIAVVRVFNGFGVAGAAGFGCCAGAGGTVCDDFRGNGVDGAAGFAVVQIYFNALAVGASAAQQRGVFQVFGTAGFAVSVWCGVGRAAEFDAVVVQVFGGRCAAGAAGFAAVLGGGDVVFGAAGACVVQRQSVAAGVLAGAAFVVFVFFAGAAADFVGTAVRRCAGFAAEVVAVFHGIGTAGAILVGRLIFRAAGLDGAVNRIGGKEGVCAAAGAAGGAQIIG